jgi:RsiW-degrading membrane proteinase PrsW (M82 family)
MDVEVNAASFLLGMIVSGVLLAMAAYPVVHLFSVIMPHHLPVLKRRPKPVEKIK